MEQNKSQEATQIKKLLVWYNMVPNVLWSVLNLVPVSIFCYSLLPRQLLYIFIGISIVALMLPNAVYNKMQLGQSTQLYKKLGVVWVNKLTQNGILVNSMIRKKFPHYKTISYQSASIHKLVQQTYAYEKFHFLMFVFFVLVTAYAISKNCWGWVLLLTVNNLLYNIYPNLLQQYIRLKLVLYNRKTGNR